MSNAGAKAQRRSKVEREFAQHAREVTAEVAKAFQPVYERICGERNAAVERAAILQTIIERIALGVATDPKTEAAQALEQLGIVPDIDVGPAEVEETES